MDITLLFSAFVLGLGGSLHCLGMCGPLVMGMPFQKTASPGFSIFNYHLGKSFAYGLLGIGLGLLGKAISLMSWQQALSIVAGLFIILFALVPHLIKFPGGFAFSGSLGRLLRKVQHHPRPVYFLAIGFLNGLLPCGLVYAALAGAAVTSGALSGFLFMFIFGMGTLPALTALAIVKSQLTPALRRKLRNFSFIISILIGALLILRGLNLGIPYISPHVHSDGHTMQCCSSGSMQKHEADTISCH